MSTIPKQEPALTKEEPGSVTNSNGGAGVDASAVAGVDAGAATGGQSTAGGDAGAEDVESKASASGHENDSANAQEKSGNKRERRKIEIKFIQEKSRRHITFSKRKAGIMKKAYELSVLTGTQVLLLVVSETGLVYTFTTPKLQPLVTRPEGKNLIQACLNAPEEPTPEEEEQQAQAQAQAQVQAQQQQQQQQMPQAQVPQGAQAPQQPQMPGQQQGPHPQSQLPPPPHQGQYNVPPQMAGGYLNPNDQGNYYMGFGGNQGYN